MFSRSFQSCNPLLDQPNVGAYRAFQQPWPRFLCTPTHRLRGARLLTPILLSLFSTPVKILLDRFNTGSSFLNAIIFGSKTAIYGCFGFRKGRKPSIQSCWKQAKCEADVRRCGSPSFRSNVTAKHTPLRFSRNALHSQREYPGKAHDWGSGYAQSYPPVASNDWHQQ